CVLLNAEASHAESGPLVPEWSFQRKLISGVIVICLLAIVSSAASLVASRMLVASVETAATEEVTVLEDARDLQRIGVTYIANVHDFVLAGGEGRASAAKAGSALLRDQAGRLKARITNPEGRSRLDEILAAERAHHDAFE